VDYGEGVVRSPGALQHEGGCPGKRTPLCVLNRRLNWGTQRGFNDMGGQKKLKIVNLGLGQLDFNRAVQGEAYGEPEACLRENPEGHGVAGFQSCVRDKFTRCIGTAPHRKAEKKKRTGESDVQHPYGGHTHRDKKKIRRRKE